MSINKLIDEIYEDVSTPITSNYSPSTSIKKNNKVRNTGLPFLSNIKSNIKNLNPELKNIIKSRYDNQTNLLFEQLNNIQRKTTPEQFKSFIKQILSKYEEWYKLAEEEAKKLKTYIDIFQTKNSNIYLPGLSEKLSNLRINLIDPFNDFHPALSDDSVQKRNYRTELIKTFMGIQENIKETIENLSKELEKIVDIEDPLKDDKYKQIYSLLYCWILYGNLISQFTNKTIEINKLEILKKDEHQKNNYKKNNQRKPQKRDQRGGKKDKKQKGKNGNKQKKSPEDTFMDNLISKIKEFEKWETSKLIEEKLGINFVEFFFDGTYSYDETILKNQNGPNGKFQFGEFDNYTLDIGNLEKLDENLFSKIKKEFKKSKQKNIINNQKLKNYENYDLISKKELFIKLKEEQVNQKSKLDAVFIKISDETGYKMSQYELEKIFKKSNGLKEHYKNYNLKNFNRIKDFPDLVSQFKNRIIKNVFEYCFFTVEFLGDFIKKLRLKYNIQVEKELKKNNERRNKKVENENKNIVVNENRVKNKKKEIEELYKAKDELFKERELLIKRSREKISNDEKEEIKILIKEISIDFEEIKKEIQKLKNTTIANSQTH
jgi:hypothetical protein